MKHIIKISLLMLVAMAVLAACQTNSEITGPEPVKAVKNSADQSTQMFYKIGNDKIPNPVMQPLLTSRNVEAGYIFITNDSENLYAEYYLNDGWQLSKAYLNVSASLQDIPRDPLGQPLPKEFNFQSTLNRCENTFSQVIPLKELGLRPGDDFVIASLAVVGANSAQGQASNPVNICVPGKADAEWWFMGSGKVSQDLNRPDRGQLLQLVDRPGVDAQL